MPESVSFPFDRMAVARFRETLPRTRWSDQLQAWAVPGTTARRRIDHGWRPKRIGRGRSKRSVAAMHPSASPSSGPYLSVFDRGFRIRTPYWRTVVDELRLSRLRAGTARERSGRFLMLPTATCSTAGRPLRSREALRAGGGQKADGSTERNRGGGEGETTCSGAPQQTPSGAERRSTAIGQTFRHDQLHARPTRQSSWLEPTSWSATIARALARPLSFTLEGDGLAPGSIDVVEQTSPIQSVTPRVIQIRNRPFGNE